MFCARLVRTAVGDGLLFLLHARLCHFPARECSCCCRRMQLHGAKGTALLAAARRVIRLAACALMPASVLPDALFAAARQLMRGCPTLRVVEVLERGACRFMGGDLLVRLEGWPPAAGHAAVTLWQGQGRERCDSVDSMKQALLFGVVPAGQCLLAQPIFSTSVR